LSPERLQAFEQVLTETCVFFPGAVIFAVTFHLVNALIILRIPVFRHSK